MKTIKLLLLLFILSQSFVAFSQDTIGGFIKSRCLQFVMPLDKMPDPTLMLYADKLIIAGQIEANCAGTHLAIVNRTVDTLFVTTKDTGHLANCVCVYQFKLSINVTPKTKKLVFNNVAYDLSTITNITHATDTLHSIFTSKCLQMGGPYPTPRFERLADSICITGTIGANCAGTHLAIVNRRNDSVFITTKDTGQLATCYCTYNFNLKFKSTPFDTLLVVNQIVYNLNALPDGIDELNADENLIDVLYDPSIESLRINQKTELKLNYVSIYDRMGSLQLTVANDRSIIDLSGFAPGLYILDFVMEDKRHITRKILK